MNETTEQVYVIKSRELEGGHSYDYAETPDGKYIGTPEFAKSICKKRGIKPEAIEGHNVCSIGFNEAEQKWYGWSHRAIFGFGIGSKVEKGDCAYTPTSPEEMIDEHAEWLGGGEAKKQLRRSECQILEDRSGVRILHAPLMVATAQSPEDVVPFIEGEIDLPEEDIAPGFSIELCGRGEWTAETMDDAKQMAIDFANGVA